MTPTAHISKSLYSVFSVALMTMLSRISGLLREMVKAYLLGTGATADAFNIAFTIPNLFRRLTAEGAMLASFIPYLSEAEKLGKDSVHRFIGAFALKLFLILIGLTLIFMFFSDFWIEYVFAPGFDDAHTRLSSDMLRIMFIYIVFLSLAAVLQGILNYNGVFGIVSFTPIVLNLCVISASFVYAAPEDIVIAMSWGVVVGGFLQMAMLYPSVRKMNYQIFRSLRFKNSMSNVALKGMIPGVWGAGIYQLNIVVSNFIASTLGTGAISALIYSNRIIELVLGIFVVSLNTVFFPGFSKALTEKNLEKISAQTLTAMCGISFVTIPVMIGLLLTGETLIRLLFERGEFTNSSTQITLPALMLYAPGIVFIGWNRLFSSVFNAHKCFKYLMYISLCSTIVNILLCVILSKYLAHGGIALASSIAQALQLIIMFTFIIKKRLVLIRYRRLIQSVGKHLMAGGIMIPAILLYQQYVQDSLPLWLSYALLILLAGACYAGAGLALKCDEALMFLRIIQSKLSRSAT